MIGQRSRDDSSPSSSFQRRGFRAVFVGVAAVQGLGYLSVFAWNLLGARSFTTESFGLLSVVVAWVVVLCQLVDVGQSRSVVRYHSVHPARRGPWNWGPEVVATAVLPCIVALVLSVALLSFPRLRMIPGVGDLPLPGALAMVAAAAGAAYVLLASGLLKAVGRPVASSVFSNVLLPAAVLAVVLWGRRLDGFERLEVCRGIGLAYGVAGLLALFTIGVTLLRRVQLANVGSMVGPGHFRDGVTFGLKAMFTGYVYMGLSVVDRLMLGALGSMEEVGHYTIAARLAFALLLVVYVFAPVAGPAYAQITRGESGPALALYRRTTLWSLLLLTPALALLVLHGEEILMLLAGSPYGAASGVLVLLGIGYFFVAATGNNGLLLQMGGKEDVELRASVGALVTNLLLNLLLIPRWGMWGAAVATVSSLLLSTATKVILAHRYWRVLPQGRRSLVAVPAALGLVGVDLASGGVLSAPWYARALLGLLAYGVLLAALMGGGLRDSLRGE